MFESIKDTMWKETIWVNFLRGVSAGIVWMVVFLIVRPPDMSIGMILTYPIAFPIGFLIIMPLISLFFKMLVSIGIPFMGLGNFVIAILVIPGDPIMFILHKVAPGIVPLEKYSFFIWNPFIWVVKEMIPGFRLEKALATADSSCPFKGRILVDKDTKVGGFHWPAKATAFIINDDWTVATPNERDFGWIDTNGEIHKGKPLGKIEPKATLSGGHTRIKIHGDNCYLKDDKIGELVK